MEKFRQLLTGGAVVVFLMFFIACGNEYSTTRENPVDTTMWVDTTPTPQQLAEQQKLLEEEEFERQKQAINYVLVADKNTAKISIDANGIRNYDIQASEMRKIDFSQCPSDFATAYLEHIHAWEDAAKIRRAEANLKEQGGLAAVAGIIAELTNSEATPFSNYLEAESELNRLAISTGEEITRTWKNVELIAVKYGGTLQK